MQALVKKVNLKVPFALVGLGLVCLRHRMASTALDRSAKERYRRLILTELFHQHSSPTNTKTVLELGDSKLPLDTLSAFTASLDSCELLSREKYPISVFHKLVHEKSTVNYDNALKWDLTPSTIASLIDEVLFAGQATFDAIAGLKEGEHTFANTILPLEELSLNSNALTSSITFLKSVSPDEKVRNAAGKAAKKLSAWYVEQGMRVDVYNSFQAFSETEEAKTLTGEEARFLKKLMLEKQLQGLHLSEAKRNKITQIKTKMSALSLEFAKNLGDEDSKHHFTKEQLAGLPDSFLEGLNKSEDGLFELDLSYPLYVPVMKECSVEATRKHMEKAFNSRCKDTNTAILEQLVTLRHQLAGIIGYSTHAKLTLVRRLAKDPAKVVTFLDDLNNKLSPLANKEMSELLQYKKAEVAEAKATDLEFKSWDWSYYMNQLVKDKYTIDNEAVKQYFPLHVVTKGMMEIYQNLLSLRFVEVENPHVWHEDVQLFNVFEAKVEEGQEQGKFVGQFYLDLYPRKGKYGHAAVWPLISGSTEPDRVRYPVCGMVCNFPKPGDSNPSLLPHNQVVTYFHEFGHVMHGICSQTRFSEFAGTSVERDFVEAPSQMLENWVYEKKALLIMSGHVDDESKKMPEEMIDSLIAAKHANVGLLTKRQLLFGIFDQTIHSADKVDTAKLYGQLHKRILGFSVTPNTNMPASFGHLAGGYDAQYYGYMWSLVFSEDMFQSKFKQDPLSAEQGALYRQHILANGSSVDADVMLERFLGRPPNSDAFLKSKGLHVSSSSTA